MKKLVLASAAILFAAGIYAEKGPVYLSGEETCGRRNDDLSKLF